MFRSSSSVNRLVWACSERMGGVFRSSSSVNRLVWACSERMGGGGCLDLAVV